MNTTLHRCQRTAWLLFGALWLMAAAFGCGTQEADSNQEPPADDTPVTPEETCTEGFLGCDCIDGIACFPGSNWICDDGTCRQPACDVGTEGCGCFSNNTCGTDAEGEPLLCQDGICAQAPCEAGTMGCPCIGDSLCQDGMECVADGGRSICAPQDCEVGTKGCPCNEDRTCLGALACDHNECVEATCRLGAPDCLCTAGFGCDEGYACDDESERCVEVPCAVGTLGCGCDEGACQGDSACIDDICQETGCVSGQEGCACLDGDTCAVDEEGQRLLCEGGMCRSDDCEPGQPGCVCENGFDCAEGSNCVDGICLEAGCEPGEEDCTCSRGACQPGLRCREDNICSDATGFISGPCDENGGCNRGGRCSNDVCIRCTLGTPGCGCDDLDGCFTGSTCLAGTCVADADLPPQLPAEIVCYTPCQDSVEIDGEYYECDENNLFEGCVGGRDCIDGQCLLPDEEPASCESELDCPSFQTCIGGYCYAECKTDLNCPAGKQCSNHVCRIACNSFEDTCPENYACLTDDGENGFCVPNAPAGEEGETSEGTFELSTTTINTNNTQVTTAFALINNTDRFQNFTIRKRSHLVQMADGSIDRAVRVNDGVVDGCEEEPCICQGDDDCVDDGFVCREGACRPAQCQAGTCPMFWLEMSEGRDDTEVLNEMEIGLAAGQGARINLAAADGSSGVRWQGALEVLADGLGMQTIDVFYNEVPEGQWAGEMVYLAQFGTNRLEEWAATPATRDDEGLGRTVGNALVRRWSALRQGNISWDEFMAVLQATQSGSWQYSNVVEDCPTEACYMYDINQIGLARYSTDLDTVPVPTGATALPFAMNLRIPDPDGLEMSGRIESAKALQYAGNPSVTMTLQSDPSGCSREAFGACLVFIDEMEADVLVGGRYLTDSSDNGCSDWRPGAGFALRQEPWLIDGFVDGTEVDDETGVRYRYECRDSLQPFASEDEQEQAFFEIENSSLAASNPIPDGRTRRRTLRLIDGVLVNQTQMFVLFEEKFESFLGNDDEGFSAYGYIVMQRRSTDLDQTDANENDILDVFEGANHVDEREEPEDVLAPQCDEDILDMVLGNRDLSADTVVDMVTALIDGVPSSAAPSVLDGDDIEQVHYFCEDTGLIDGGPENGTPHDNQLANNNDCTLFADNGVCEDGGVGSDFSVCELGTDFTDCGIRTADDADVKIECPAGSNVIFFTVDSDLYDQRDIANLPCQLAEGGCRDQVNQWLEAANPIIQEEPVWRCTDDRAYCDDNRQDLRDGKSFYAAADQSAVFVPLQALIDEAFRYKTRFQNRDGQGIGFAPDVCIPGSNLTPYCYDPGQIEEIQARIDCLLHIHQNFYEDLDTNDRAARIKLDEYLTVNFSFDQEFIQGRILPINHDGFERQLAQLLIMLGDDAFTKAFASRFDLAASNTASFEGELFEEGGINLSGVAGFEMVSLYQAAQYYQMILDRFYRQSTVVWDALGYAGEDRNFVTAETVVNYFDRVVRASTQKATAWSKIAERYQALGEPDLARKVAERAYAATYLESVVMSRMMLRVVEASEAADRAQIRKAVEDAQLRYGTALLDMRKVHSAIDDNITIFGFEPDFVPFPALDSEDFRQSNAFEVFLLRARPKVQFAREREELALNSNREFETNQAQFQSELNQIRLNFEGQLGDLCGTFIADDNRVYPAIRKYAHLSQRATVLGDPCGQMGNGQIHEAYAAFDELALDARQLEIQQENVIEEVEIERARVSGLCRETLEAADFLYGKCTKASPSFEDFIDLDNLNPFNVETDADAGCIQAQINDLQSDIRASQFGINRIQSITGAAVSAAATPLSASFIIAASAVGEVGVSILEGQINATEDAIADLERSKMLWQTENECDMAKVESEARTATILLRLKELELEGLRLEHRTRLAISALERLRHQAQKIQLDQQETEQLTINVQAAHNNPNVRIYKNDAIINAEIAFDDAIREVYKLTKVFEYYTSTSYANKNDLFLTRMIARGDKNLENYLIELENTFFEFEGDFGHPEQRVHIVSLKDDILAIPYTDDEGRALNDLERTELMRARLTDPSLLDKTGTLTMPFGTNLEQVSPLTYNHKILHVEADVFGNDLGDFVGRVYVRQKGTGVIRAVDATKQFYRFDERTAVVNTIFSGVRFFQLASYYQNFRHRDRPFVNTHWELGINQRTEQVNEDINLQSLSDIRLYIYYTDLSVD